MRAKRLRQQLFDRDMQAKELDQMLEAVFGSRSWRIGFGITRLLRRFARSKAPTTLEKWKQFRRTK